MLADRNSSPVETTDRYPKCFANCVANGATAAMTTAKGSVATAVCNAVYPRNAWNHWVVMKMKPNRQKNATQIAQVLLVNVALRNRPTSMSGACVCPSTAANTASMIRAAQMPPMTCQESQP